MAERLVRALLVVGALVLTAAPAAAQDGRVAVDGAPCPDGAGVTVVIDFQELGDDTVLVRCAPDAPQDGFEALEQAGIPYRTAVAFPGFLCRIADRPEDDPCDTASQSDAYWSYWLAPAGGEWCYSNKGAANRTPPAGAVEGWSFSLDNIADDVPPPRYEPPGDPEGASPLASDDCTTAAVSSETEPGVTSSTTTGTDEAVGQGDAVELDSVDDGGGSPVGTLLGVAAVIVVAGAAVLVARRSRRPSSPAAPTATDDGARPRSPGPAPLPDDSMWARPPADDEQPR